MVNARIRAHQLGAVCPGNDERGVVGIGTCAALDGIEARACELDQPIHSVGLSLEVSFLECFRVARRAVRLVAIRGIEWIELGIQYRRCVLRDDLGVIRHCAVQSHDGARSDAVIGIDEDQTVGGR